MPSRSYRSRMVLTVTGAASVACAFMRADFRAGRHTSIQWLYSIGTVWIAAARAEFAAVHKEESDGVTGVVAGAAFDVLATSGVIAGTGVTAALATTGGAFADSG